MTQSRWMFGAGVLTLACLGGLLGGTAVYWSHQPQFPLYGYIFDACVAAVLVFSVLRLKRWKAKISDEFTVAKQRIATQVGLTTGFVLFVILSLLPHLLPHFYRGVLAPFDGYEGFNLGQTFGMLPFAIGIVVGQVAAWMKYR
ncbi:MAG: hypothetical protein WDN06_06430 [Asticcacaulis sp.]